LSKIVQNCVMEDEDPFLFYMNFLKENKLIRV